MDGIFLSRGNRGFPRKELRLDCAQAFHALHEKLTLARREVFFRSAEPPDKMDLHFILRLRAQNSARLLEGAYVLDDAHLYGETEGEVLYTGFGGI